MKKVLAVLGLQTLTFQSNFWDKGGEAYVKMNKEQIEKIDAAIPDETPEGSEDLAKLQGKITGFQNNETAVQEALTAALKLNGIDAVEGQSPAEAIAALGTKCKEFGDSKETHSLANTDGKDKNPDADQSAKYAHNQVFNDDKFKTLK